MELSSVHTLEMVCGMTCLDSSSLKDKSLRQGWPQPVRSHVLFCAAVLLSSSSAADFCIARIKLNLKQVYCYSPQGLAHLSGVEI